jgi:hypothetical protein
MVGNLVVPALRRRYRNSRRRDLRASRPAGRQSVRVVEEPARLVVASKARFHFGSHGEGGNAHGRRQRVDRKCRYTIQSLLVPAQTRVTPRAQDGRIARRVLVETLFVERRPKESPGANR